MLPAVHSRYGYKCLFCGYLKQGFARVRCRKCGHEYLLADSCKRWHFCTSCHTKRAAGFAEWLHTTALWPVAHRQIVLTIPKRWRADPRRRSRPRRRAHRSNPSTCPGGSDL